MSWTGLFISCIKLRLPHLATQAKSPNDEIRRSLVLNLKLIFKTMEVNTIEIHQKILRRRLLVKIGCTGMFLGLAIGLSIPFMLTAILHLLGFGTKGIIPGSIAAEWQASLHNLTKGTFFACKYFLVSICHTVRNLHFMSKHSTLISRENCRLSWVKNSWKCCGFWLFSSWQLWFHEKNYQ